ncbi:hypothetical protein K490DRAFT_33338 [Saccharata proteae CBS 121410]|uniref:Uncharacterized protein n=1 Tax=Saccharata proteae CBS 121410 TaxID=1314787 RepID=A0A9P4I225_9PEZI|nr:hypothetical protein K490DRAFT_33338 [Saccharata proteae CBS 121410]
MGILGNSGQKSCLDWNTPGRVRIPAWPLKHSTIYSQFATPSFTYDHRSQNIGHPVRSAIHKL